LGSAGWFVFARRNSGKRSRFSRLWRLALWCALGAFLITWFAVFVMRFVPPVSSAFMLERRLAGLREKNFSLHYRWTPIEQVSPNLPIALVAAEDQKFPLHHGFDVEAIADAIEDAEDGERMRGASTISQQTAKNLFLWNGHNFVRKGFEVYFTVLLETTWPKRRILEVYLNIAEFGDGIYGASAASDAYFHKPVSALSEHESALLAAVLPNPKKYRPDKPSPYVLRRAAWIEKQVHQLGGAGYVEKK
jgi:monofunctional biosynthetic peptidoglycan transglycosylase